MSAIGNTANVAGGTAWLWARPDAAGAVDVLFIDEAAQMSLANVLAVSQAATSVVLLGDPQQLEQPMQGSHPEGTEGSALHHILGGRRTLTADRGLFLDETWRLTRISPISPLNSFMRAASGRGLASTCRTVIANGRLNGTGLRYLEVPHEGNQSSSPEEADCVRDLVERSSRRRRNGSTAMEKNMS